MKVEVNQKSVEPKSEYPCLKVRESGLIVLFTSSKTGTVIQSDNYHQLGEYGIDWIESKFTPFTGTITLSND
mgnify:CR=1 FL=1